MKNLKLYTPILLAFFCVGCGPAFLKKLLSDHPEVIIESIKKNPVKYMEALSEAQGEYIKKRRELKQKERLAKREAEFANPHKPSMPANRVYFGPKNAPITIVEYADFQCGYCARAARTVKQVMKAYPGKVRVLYKHFPVTGAPHSVPAAKYYEAIGRQDPQKARSFHDSVFEKGNELRSGGEKFLKSLVKQLKVDEVQLEKDLKQVGDVITADRKEAVKFEFSGTPGFLVGGVTVPGAVLFPEFKTIIDRHLKDRGSKLVKAKEKKAGEK